MRYLYGLLSCVGLILVFWGSAVNRVGSQNGPDTQPKVWITTGPYRFMKHPIYLGNWMVIAGLAGLAGGFFNLLAIGYLAELLLCDWITREKKHSV